MQSNYSILYSSTTSLYTWKFCKEHEELNRNRPEISAAANAIGASAVQVQLRRASADIADDGVEREALEASGAAAAGSGGGREGGEGGRRGGLRESGCLLSFHRLS